MKHCMYCNTLMAKDAVFCPKCGKRQNNINNIHTENISNDESNSDTSDTILGSWVDFWKRFYHGHGFSSRKQYWSAVLINAIIVLLLFLGGSLLSLAIPLSITAANYMEITNALHSLYIIFGLIILIPSVSLNCRRLRDIGASNGEVITLIICDFIPIINWISSIINLVCVCLPTSKNRRK